MRQKQFLLAFLAMLLCFASPTFAQVAKIGDTEYATLAGAISYAKAGQTITLIGDVNEDVTINKSLTIDGAGKQYTGTMTGGIYNITVKNLKFSNSLFQKTSSGTKGNYSFEDCQFIGAKNGYYPLLFSGANTLELNDCDIKNCPNGLYVKSSILNVNLTSVNFNDLTGYGVYFASGVNNNAFTNVSFKNVGNGVIYNNTSDRTLNFKGCSMEDVNTSISHAKGTSTITCNLSGANNFGTAAISDYARINAQAKINDKNVYGDLASVVAAANADETVQLLKDATGAGVVIDKNITIDFNDKTYSFNEGVGSTGTESNGFQILNGNNVTLKNGTLNVAAADAAKFYILVQNYANLTVEGMNLDGTNLDKWSKVETDQDSYVLSNNSGNVLVKGNTNITANNDGDKAFAFDACLKAPYNAPVVTIETTGKIEGKIENSAKIVIKSGTFTIPLDASWFEAGYSCKDNGDGTYGVAVSAVKVGDKYYETLAAAIKAATAGQTITLVKDLTENVTINKSLTIDGADHTFTGNIKATNRIDVVIKNVNFDGNGYNGYAVDANGAYNITVEDCTVKNYGYGFLQNASGTVSTTVKNVTIEGVNYGVKVDYANEVLLENVKMTNVKFGILNSNYGAKTITIKNSELTTLNIWERNLTTYTTFKFEGINTITAFPESTLVKYEGVILGNNAYGELTDALAEVKADDVLNIYSNYTIADPINVTSNLTINGNGKTLTYTGSGSSARAITVESTANGANLTLKNLTIDCTSSYCQRGINYNTNGALELDGVTVKGTNVTYALNLPGSSDNAQVTIKDSSLTGNIALNVWGENATINAENSNFISVDNNSAEGYAAVKLNNDGVTAAEGTVINITGGKIDVTGTACTDTEAVSNATSTGKINISETTVNGEVATMVAAIRYDNGTSYSFKTIEDAIATAKDGETIELLSDITASEIVTINKAVTIDGNGKTLKSTAARAINVETEGKVAISNLTINAAERAINIINKPATVELNGVTATANNNAVMIATSAGAANVSIDRCDFTGLAVVNVAGAKSNVAIKNSKITNVDATEAENYGAITVWTSAEEAVVNVESTTITVADDSKKAYVFPATATVNGVDEVGYIIATVGDAGFDTLAKAVEYAKADQTINVVRSATGAGVVIDKNITIDFNGKTYTFNEGVGSAGTQTLGLQILKDNNVTLKNGTLTSEGGNVKMLVQNYANLTVDNMKLVDATDAIQYVLSNNCGNVVVKNASEITANGAIAFDACKYANYALPTVTIEEGVVVTGDVEVSATLNMNGTLNGNIIINGAEGVVNGAEGLNVTTNIDGRKVAYVDGKYTVVEMTYVAQVGEAKYETLAEAVVAAEDGATVTMLANAEENVTLSKNVTIDGAQKNYTGTMTVNNVTATIQNVAFVKGQVYKHKNTGSSAKITIKDCTFDGQGLNAYAVNVGNGVNLALENVRATNYGYGILQVPSSFSSISVKDVEVSNMYYGFKVDYAGAVSMENVTVADDVTIGIYDSNYGDKTYTIKNCKISTISIWERQAAKTTTFKFEGLNKVNTLTTSQYAKIDAQAKSSNNYYGELAAVVEAAPAGATVELLADVTLEGGNEKDAEAGLVIDKAMTLDGKNHTIDCGTFVKGIRLYGLKNLTDMKINNVTIVNSNANGRCVDTRKGYLRLKFSNAHLFATNGNSQPLTVGGSDKLHQIDLSECTIDAGNSGYGIISFVPVNQAIKLINTDVTGYAGIYLKGEGTKVTITTNSNVIGKNVHSGETNRFGAVVFEGNNNTVNINATSPMLKAIAEGGAEQAAILVKSGSGNNVVLETAKGAEILVEGNNAYWAMVSANATGTTITKNGVEVALGAECDGYQFVSLEEALRISKNESTVKLLADVALDTKKLVAQNDGYATLINVADKALTFDLNGKTMTVNATASDLANAKGGMLLSVFHADTNGQLTLVDSSDAQTGAVNVLANDAKVYCLAASESQYTDKSNSGKIIVNGGTYTLDRAADSMFFSDANEVITINGGNFTLKNVGTGSNGMPWIFNTYGRNERHVNVNGGTFNADINHQYWAFEVNVPMTRALCNNGNDTWTMVDAEAWVLEKYDKDYNREVGYATLEEALAVANNVNNTVTLAKDVEVVDMITVANGKELVLNLNGKTLSAIDNTSKNYSLIDNRGDLTITGEGKMTVKATVNSGWNRYSAVIANNPGGKLIIESGCIEHLGGTDMAYGIDNLTNGKGTYAETIINGGTIKSPYRAVRQFLNGVEAQNILTVNGGTIEGTNKSIFFHDPSKNANTGSLTVGEDATLKGDVYLFVTAGSTEWPVKVKIAKAALENGSKVVDGNVPEGYAVSEYPTYWTVEALNLAELTIDDNCESYVNVVEKNVGKLTYVREFDNTEWQTIYLPFAVPASKFMNQGLEVAYIYNASYMNGVAAIKFVEIEDADYVLQANYPYLIRAKEAGDKSIVVENATLMPTAVKSIDCSSVFETFTFTGNYETIEDEPCDATCNKRHFVMNEGAWTGFNELNPFRVYLTIELRNGDAFPTEESIKMVKVDKNGNVDTSVEKIGVDADILGIYDLQGRRVLEPQKGEIYIINGKKVVY